jgi:hypothetical protein
MNVGMSTAMRRTRKPIMKNLRSVPPGTYALVVATFSVCFFVCLEMFRTQVPRALRQDTRHFQMR